MTEKRDEQGLSLMDIGPMHELVPLNAEGTKTLKVFGVSVKGVFTIFQRFPEVGKWFQGGKLDVPSLSQQAPDAIGAAIAAGCGFGGNKDAEDRADSLPIETQIDILEAIFRLTFKSGFGPFAQRMALLSAAAKSQNYGRGQVTTSPPGSKPASPLATEPNTSGDSPLDK